MAQNDIVRGLWIGDHLSLLERLSIASFIHHGHTYHLYVYDEIASVPPGTVLKDASEVLPASRIFKYSGHPSYAGFSNYFRYKLLQEYGGWWVDTDMVCLKPLNYSQPYVFATELFNGKPIISSCILKVPVGCDAISYAWEMCECKDTDTLSWGETGPKLMTEAVYKFRLEEYARPTTEFCPLGPYEWRKVLNSQEELLNVESSTAVHFWNEKWRRENQDKNADYPSECLYSRLKRTYLHC